MDESLHDAVAELERSAVQPERFSAIFVDVFPVHGAAVSTLGSLLGSETVSASDEGAARLDELQFDLGEGPCWEALSTALPALEPDFGGSGARRWPMFAAAAADQRVASIFAFPVIFGALRLGAVDLYSRTPTALDPAQRRQASVMAGLVGRHLIRRALTPFTAEQEDATPHSRRTIHQATGVVLAQLDVDPDDAAMMIQAHAFARGATMMSVAEDILTGTLVFRRVAGRIEVGGDDDPHP